jgi:hypothetical protein
MIDETALHKLLGLGDVSASPLLIYSDQTNSRFTYVCEFIFNHGLKINHALTNDLKEFEASTLFKINYSDKTIDSAFQILPSDLLAEINISENKPQPEIKNEMIYFFGNKQNENIHFDIFSAIFYFISRYEEWQNFEKDIHDRFELKESILFKYNFHLKPVVDIWIEELKNALVKKYPALIFPKKVFKTISTIDVDNLFAYKNKGLFRTAGAALKDLLKFDFQNLKRRLSVTGNKTHDPFDIYESFSKYCNENKLPLIYFFLFKTGTKYDRTVNPNSESFKNVFEVIKKNKAFIGLHPSYYSAGDVTKLSGEIDLFSDKLSAKVTLSRQHYLRFDIRKTPVQLMSRGILADFSMGFASGPGFRAGTSQPFYFYDFNLEKKIKLLMVPFCAMDGAYFVYSHISAAEAYQSILKIKEEIKKANGLFITVFHERTFAGHLYPGFGEMYKKLLLS